MKIAILGAGAYGTALGTVLAGKGYDIDYYDPILERESLKKVVEGAKFIVLTTPSSVVPRVLAHLPHDTPLIIATKGFLNTRVFADFSDYMVISGPGYAEEIKVEKPTRLTATDERIIDLFQTEWLGFDFTLDKTGVLMCGALKNVYALYAGYLKLTPDTPDWQAYITGVAEEMKALLSSNNAEANTVDLACGKGDLKLTCQPPSRNYAFGALYRDNPEEKPTGTVEGLATLYKIRKGVLKLPNNLKYLDKILEIFKEVNRDETGVAEK